MKSSKPVYWRVPDSLTDINSYLEGKVTWFEVNDWLIDFKSDFLKIENKEIFDELRYAYTHNSLPRRLKLLASSSIFGIEKEAIFYSQIYTV